MIKPRVTQVLKRIETTDWVIRIYVAGRAPGASVMDPKLKALEKSVAKKIIDPNEILSLINGAFDEKDGIAGAEIVPRGTGEGLRSFYDWP